MLHMLRHQLEEKRHKSVYPFLFILIFVYGLKWHSRCQCIYSDVNLATMVKCIIKQYCHVLGPWFNNVVIEKDSITTPFKYLTWVRTLSDFIAAQHRRLSTSLWTI